MVGEAKQEEEQQDNTGGQEGNDDEKVFSDMREQMKMNLMKQREKKEKTPKHPQGKASSQEQWWACHPDSPYRLKGCSSEVRKSCQYQA